MQGISTALEVTLLAGRRHKLSNIPYEVLVVDVTSFRTKSIDDMVEALVFFSMLEPDSVRIVKELTTGFFGDRPTCHPSLF